MSVDASADELRAAYRRRARRLHPDAAGSTASLEMARLNEAWRVLRDPGRRALYDASLRGPAPASAPRPAARPDEDEAGFVPAPHGARWAIPLPWVLVLGVFVLIFVFTAYAASSGRSGGNEVDGLLRTGSCVRVLPGAVAIEVPCDAPNDGTVVGLPPFESPCPAGSEGLADRNSMSKVCVRFP